MNAIRLNLSLPFRHRWAQVEAEAQPVHRTFWMSMVCSLQSLPPLRNVSTKLRHFGLRNEC